MLNFSPVAWVPWIPWLGAGYVSWDTLYTAFQTPNKVFVGSVYLAIYLLASFWQGQVTKIVAEPYLDEIFHVPQAQAYCVGDFHIWDPKLTTPPGLYALATLFGNLGGIRSCNVYTLRLLNVLALIATMANASDCRALITRAWKRSSKEDPEALSPNVLHTAFNIALFPPLFFFSGLFYTDVLSTCVVLRTYRLFLQRKGSIWLYLAGILVLTMRQTNIFWVAVFLGGLEAVEMIKSLEIVPLKESPQPQTWKGSFMLELQRYSRGEIHDISLKDAEIQDFALCALSIAIAILNHPVLIIRKLWPYVALLLSFAAFVFWNGGVVLGDKSNHVATIHLPQLLYLSAFIAFFSFPILIPSILHFIQPLLSALVPSLRPPPTSSSSSAKISRTKVLITGMSILGSLLAILIITRFNTLIHPFTLADNRHYVFYVFRYSILFHPLIRYLLAPIYLLCIYLTYLTLSGSPPLFLSSPSASRTAPSSPTKPARPKTAVHHRIQAPSKPTQDSGPSTSFLLIYLLSTALCLITAPLVEPRYFILPWILWRLHVPSYSHSPHPRKGRQGWNLGAVLTFWLWKGHDYRLWLETIWFLAIDAVTGYVFLYRGFEWVQEPGKVQRFMW